jgi:hypothetical protein
VKAALGSQTTVSAALARLPVMFPVVIAPVPLKIRKHAMRISLRIL